MDKTDNYMDRLGSSGDEFYECLMKVHEGLDESESHSLNAKLVLLMANEIGDISVLTRLLDIAGKSHTA